MARSWSVPDGAIRVALPSVRQRTAHTCGPAALLSVCAYYGVGPSTEAELADAMGTTTDGTDPDPIERAARSCGLRTEAHWGMSAAILSAVLAQRRPVVMMLQAWAEPAPRSYRRRWRDGHWVVAIGEDEGGIYFEDPALRVARGYLTHDELDERWHDVHGTENERVERYGLVVWRPGARRREIRRDERARTIG